jgi:hypothetical protein
MKGRNYVPHTGTFTRLEWHWNDGIYTYGNRRDMMQANPKPWDFDPQSPVLDRQVVYNWRASVPQGWYRLKARECFKSVKELNLHSNTLEFLDQTQKYIHLISHPSHIEQHIKSAPQLISPSKVSKQPSALLSSASPLHHTAVSPPHVQFDGVEASLYEKKSPLRRLRTPSPTKQRRRWEFDVKGGRKESKTERLTGDSYVVTSYARPRALHSAKRSRRGPIAIKNIDIQCFLDRFEKQKEEDPELTSPNRSATAAKQNRSLSTFSQKRSAKKVIQETAGSNSRLEVKSARAATLNRMLGRHQMLHTT